MQEVDALDTTLTSGLYLRLMNVAKRLRDTKAAFSSTSYALAKSMDVSDNLKRTLHASHRTIHAQECCISSLKCCISILGQWQRETKDECAALRRKCRALEDECAALRPAKRVRR